MQSPEMIGKKKRGRPPKIYHGMKCSYIQCKRWIQKMGFSSWSHWEKYCKTYVIPVQIPKSFDTYYKEYEGDAIFFGVRPPRFMSYENAKKLVNEKGIQTHLEYTAFIKTHNHPERRYDRLPVWPYLCKSWKDQWINYNHFFNNENVYKADKRKQYASYGECKAFVHQLNFTSMAQWIEWHKQHNPKFIPRLPHVSFKDQFKPKDWLGKDPVSRLETRQQFPGVWAILHDKNQPQNCFQIKKFCGGPRHAKWECKNNNFQLIAMYKVEHELTEQLEDIIKEYSTSYDEGEFYATNISQLRYQLDNLLLIVK